MEINNTLDLILYVVCTIATLFILLPMGISCTVGGIKLFIKYRFKTLPENLLARKYGKTSIEVLFVGFFSLVFSLWYLFLDKGGNLVNLFNEVTKFLSK